MPTQRHVDLSQSELRRYVTETTDRTASDGELFKGLIRAHLLAEGGEVLDVLRHLLEEASATHQRESLHPDHDKLDVFQQWITQREWITECVVDAIAQAPPGMKAAGERVIQQIDETTSALRGDVAAARFEAGLRGPIVAPFKVQLKKK